MSNHHKFLIFLGFEAPKPHATFSELPGSAAELRRPRLCGLSSKGPPGARASAHAETSRPQNSWLAISGRITVRSHDRGYTPARPAPKRSLRPFPRAPPMGPPKNIGGPHGALARFPDCQILPDHRIARLPACRIAGVPDCQIARLPDWQMARLPGCLII